MRLQITDNKMRCILIASMLGSLPCTTAQAQPLQIPFSKCEIPSDDFAMFGTMLWDPALVLDQTSKLGLRQDVIDALEKARGMSELDRRPAGLRAFEIAADRGYLQSQLVLANIYWSGMRGVSKDERKSLYWFRRAANQGAGHAMIALAVSQIANIGGESDPAEGYFWLLAAQSHGQILLPGTDDDWSESLPTLVKEMEQFLTPEKRLVVQERVSIWSPTIERDPCSP